MSQWKRLKGDCPICNGARKHEDCRQSRSTGFVFCHDDQANPVGWIFKSFDKAGFGIWQDERDAEAQAQQSLAERDTNLKSEQGRSNRIRDVTQTETVLQKLSATHAV